MAVRLVCLHLARGRTCTGTCATAAAESCLTPAVPLACPQRHRALHPGGVGWHAALGLRRGRGQELQGELLAHKQGTGRALLHGPCGQHVHSDTCRSARPLPVALCKEVRQMHVPVR